MITAEPLLYGLGTFTPSYLTVQLLGAIVTPVYELSYSNSGTRSLNVQHLYPVIAGLVSWRSKATVMQAYVPPRRKLNASMLTYTQIFSDASWEMGASHKYVTLSL